MFSTWGFFPCERIDNKHFTLMLPTRSMLTTPLEFCKEITWISNDVSVCCNSHRPPIKHYNKITTKAEVRTLLALEVFLGLWKQAVNISYRDRLPLQDHVWMCQISSLSRRQRRRERKNLRLKILANSRIGSTKKFFFSVFL